MRKKTLISLFMVMGIAVISRGQPAQERYRLLVAYTQEYADAQTDELLHIQDNVENYINAILLPNCNLGHIQAELVCVWNSGYNESRNHGQDLQRFRVDGDGFMDDVTRLAQVRHSSVRNGDSESYWAVS